MRWFWYVLVFGFVLSLVMPDGSELDSGQAAIETTPKIPARAQQTSFGKGASKVAAEASKPIKAAPTNLYVTGNSVNQRAGPGIGHNALGQLYKGNIVAKLSESGGWTQIRSSKGEGWISSNYVSTVDPKTIATTKAQTSKRAVALPASRDEQAARSQIIKQSIASYPGSCPCPYNRDRAGRRCGKRSAWSKPGGYSPICYDSDVSQARLASYFARRRGAGN